MASRSKLMPTRCAMSRARRIKRSTAPRSARSWRSRPITTRMRNDISLGSSSARPRRMSRSSSNAAMTQANDWSAAPTESTTIRARRGCAGTLSIARPTSVMRWLASNAPSSSSSSAPCAKVRGGGASGKVSSAAEVPHAASSSASPARSTWVISASRWARRVDCSSLLHAR